MMNKINGKIAYVFYYKLDDVSNVISLKNIYEENNENFIKDYKIAEDFLNMSPFGGEKFYVKNSNCSIYNTKVNSLQIVATVYRKVKLVEILLNFGFEDADTDSLVFMHHILEKPEAAVKCDIDEYNGKTINKIVECILKKHIVCIDFEKTHNEKASIIEINSFNGEKNDKEVYGILVGDEGYTNVPNELTSERTKNLWSSREFVSFIAFSNKFLIFNLDEIDNRESYLKRENEFQTHYHGNLNPYFTFKPIIAGLNHGFLFAIENVMLVKSLAKSYFTQHEKKKEESESKSATLKKDIAKIKEDKEELELVLANFEKIGIAELGVLEYKIIEKIQIIPLIEEIKYMLGLIESKLESRYSEDTNFKVDILTGLSILISLIALIFTIFDHL